MIGYELYRLLSLKKNKKPRNRKKKNDTSKLASDTKDKVPDILDDIDIDKQNAISKAAGLSDIGDFNSNNSNSINMTDSSKLENLDRPDLKEKTKEDFQADKKDDDDDTDEEKKLLEGMKFSYTNLNIGYSDGNFFLFFYFLTFRNVYGISKAWTRSCHL